MNAVCLVGSNTNLAYLCLKLSRSTNISSIYVWTLDKFDPQRLTSLGSNISCISTDNEFTELVKSKKINYFFPVDLGGTFRLNKFMKEFFPEGHYGTILGPSSKLAMDLEWSKISCKKLFKQLDIPTPNFKIIPRDELLETFFSIKTPFVFKLDKDYRNGMQTIVVTDKNSKEVYDYILNTPQRALKYHVHEDHSDYIVEDYVEKKYEYSVHIICQGDKFMILGSARDYKTVGDGDTGYNSNSTGCYSLPHTHLPDEIYNSIKNILIHLKEKNTPYNGLMYINILVDMNDRQHILEINARGGNPELISILEQLDENVLDLLVEGCLHNEERLVRFKTNVRNICLVISKYHQNEDNKDDYHFDQFSLPHDIFFIDGMNEERHCVLSVSKSSVKESADYVYEHLKNINIKNLHYRTDVGYLK